MIIELLENNNYLIKLLDNTINIYNKEDLQKITERIYKKIMLVALTAFLTVIVRWYFRWNWRIQILPFYIKWTTLT